MNTDVKMLWTDLETGGLNPRDHDITEIACLVDINGEVVEEFELLLCPAFAARVTPEALKVQGQTLEAVMAHPTNQREAWGLWKKMLGRYVNPYSPEDKFVWAGQNPQFDLGFARALWRREGDAYFGSWFHHAPVDLMATAAMMKLRGHLPGLANFKQQSIMNALGVGGVQSHRALDDIRNARACFYKLLEKIPQA